MKKKLFSLILFTFIFALQLLWAGPENNPPKCPPHDYADPQYNCNVGASVTGSTESRTKPCSTKPSSAISTAEGAVTTSGDCKKYEVCKDCSEENSLGTISVSKTGSMSNPNTEANGTLKPGTHSVNVCVSCHRDQNLSVGIHITGHELLLDGLQKEECYMTGKPAHSYYIGYVQKQSFKVPVGNPYRFAVDWTPPAGTNRAGREIYKSYKCTTCSNTWDFAENSWKTVWHREKFPDYPETTGEENKNAFYRHEIKFPNAQSYSVSFSKECDPFSYTFSGWKPENINVGGCTSGTYDFNVEAIGVKELSSYSNYYDRGDDHWYLLSHIDADPDKKIEERKSILKLYAWSTSGTWPTENPYYNPLYDYDPLNPDKDKVKYPKWSCSPPSNYSQPGNYEFYCQATPPASPTDVDGSTSVNFKGKSYGLYTIAASCGTDVHEGADTNNNIAKKTKWVHVIDPKVKVNVDLPLCTIVDSGGKPSATHPPIKALSLDCSECRLVKVNLDLSKNGTDIGDLKIKITPEKLYPKWDLPEYELYVDHGQTKALEKLTVKVDESDETHQLYSLAHNGAQAIYILMKTPGYITTELNYKLGSYIDETHSEKFMVIPKGCSGSTCTMPNPTANVDSIDYRFNLGNSAFGDAGGFFQVKSDTLTKNLFSLDNLNIIIGPRSTVTYDTNYDGYPTLIDTGLYKTAFTYERETLESGTFVKKITAQYSQSGSSTILSTIVMSIDYDSEGIVSAFNTSYTKHTSSGDIVQNWSYNQVDAVCPDLGESKTFWVLNEDGVNTYVTYQVTGNQKTEYRYIGSITNPVEKTITVEQLFEWGYETVSETKHGLTTTYEYYNDTWGGRQGWIKKITYPRGNSTEYFYDASGNITRELTLEGGATKETINQYEGNKKTTTRKYDNTVVSKTESVSYYGDYSNPDTYKVFDENDNATITTTYKINNSSSEYHGKDRLVKRPDGTVTVTEYAKANDEETITTYDGVPDDPNSTTPTVVDGTKSVYRTNSAGQMIYSASWDIATNTKLSEQTAISSDSFGRITKYHYMDGSYSESTYGCCGVDWSKDRNGVETTYAYNDNGTLNYTVRNGITTLYSYDALRNVVGTTVKGRNNTELTSSKVYTNGVLTSSKDPMNHTTTYSNNGDTVTYPNGTTSITNYTQGVVTSTSGTAVHGVTYSYGPNWQKTMPQNITVHNDMLGRQYKTVYADDTYSETFYNSKGQAVKQVSPGGKITLTEYDTRGRVYRKAIDMDLNGIIDGNDEITQYAYSFGTKNSKAVSVTTVTRIVGSNSKVLSVSENVIGGMEAWTTSNGLTRHSLTERLGNGQTKTTIENPDGSKSIAYTTNGLTTKVEKYNLDGSAGNVTEYTYDEFDRIATVTEKYGTTIINEVVNSNYNANGQPQTVTTNGKATTYEYDNMGRRTSVTLPGGRTVTYTYKDTGELATIDGAETYKRSNDYDDQGRMHTLTTYQDVSTPQVTTWNYNNRGFLASKIYADNKGTNYTYTADGQLATRVWARGITTSYSYDNAGRQLTVDYSDTTPDITYTYDWMGNVSTVQDAAGTRTFTYDYVTSGHPGLVSVTIPSIINNSINYTYDAYGRTTEMSLKNGSTAVFTNTYGYDSVTGRMATVGDGTYTAHYTYQDGTGLVTQNQIMRDSDSSIITTHNRSYDARTANYHLLSVSNTTGANTRVYSYEYNDKDQRTKLTLPDGSYWEYTYDDKGQVTSGVKKDASGTAIAGQNFGYTYDGIGNRKTETDGMPDMLFNYTSNILNQYTQCTVPGAVPIAGSALIDATVKVKDVDSGLYYDVDRNGNYFTKAVPVDNTSYAKEVNLEIQAVKFDASQDKDVVQTVSGKYMVPQTPQAYTYDNDGNMLTNGDWSYTWNGENRLIVAEKSDMKLEFVYDFMGRRISKKVYTGSTGNWTLSSEKKFVYNGYKQIAEFNSSDVLQKTYTWQPVDLDVPLWVKDGSNYYYYIVDGNKNIRSMVDVSGNEVASYDYNPFGEVVVSSGAYKDTNKYCFSSEYHDDETGLVYYNYRYYDVELGRWTKRDPIEEKGGGNLYGMVHNDTVNDWDYYGQESAAKSKAELAKLVDTAIKKRKQVIKTVTQGGTYSYASSCYKKAGCKALVILIVLPDPAKILKPSFGHTGVGIRGSIKTGFQNDFWDYGPTNGNNSPGRPWWDKMGGSNDQSLTSITGDVKNDNGNIAHVSRRSDVFKISICICNADAKKVTKWWQNKYKNLGIWSLMGDQCTTTVRDSLNTSLNASINHNIKTKGVAGLFTKSPEQYLLALKNAHITHGCGSHKGKEVKFIHLNKGSYRNPYK